MSKLPRLIIAASLIFLTLLPVSSIRSDTGMINEKVSSQLLTQINLRKAQIANPTSDRLKTMKEIKNGRISIADSLIIKQYLVGQLTSVDS